jgi:hypothetical protein
VKFQSIQAYMVPILFIFHIPIFWDVTTYILISVICIRADNVLRNKGIRKRHGFGGHFCVYKLSIDLRLVRILGQRLEHQRCNLLSIPSGIIHVSSLL